MKTMVTIDELVARHGEPYRPMIEDAIRWLDVNEPKWGLRRPMSRKGFIERLVRKAKPPGKDGHA